MDDRNLTWHGHQVTAEGRAALLGQRGAVLWLTGLSGSGKSTLAMAAEARLLSAGRLAYVLDGDNVRHGLNADLGFADADRRENIRRVGEVARLLADAGLIVLAAFISPFREDRARVAARVGDGFHEIHVATSLDVCEARDPKGLYQRARDGLIPAFTGISSPYEAPESPALRIDTGSVDLEVAVDALVDLLEKSGTFGQPRSGVVA
ncbi:MAG: adenylyl-sulfate kinase [bacterium]